MSHYSQHEGFSSKPVEETAEQAISVPSTGAIAEAKKIVRLRLVRIVIIYSFTPLTCCNCNVRNW